MATVCGSPPPRASEHDAEVTIPENSATTPRCILFFPGSRPELYEKAIASGADGVCLDLEDAVAADAKTDARTNAMALVEGRSPGSTRLTIRINHPSTSEGEQDLLAISSLDGLGEQSISLMIPKVDSPDDVEAVRARLGDKAVQTSFIAMIETVRGVAAVEDVACVDGVSALLFGGLDLSIDLGAVMEWEPLLYARSRVVHAARLGSVPAIDMPFLDVADPGGLREEADRVRRLGFKGKAAIHPDQVTQVTDAFCHTPGEVARARRVTKAVESEGDGAFLLDGKMVDRPVIDAARRIVEWADAHGC